jgi:ABC-type antimicrobial peptide transport system permease subunit
MSNFTLLIRSLTHYWRTNLAVLLGVIAGTAVIGGALIVGDSVKGSLRQMSLDRLGDIDHAVHSHRFFRQQLAADIASTSGFRKRFDSIAPVLQMSGAFVHEFSLSREPQDETGQDEEGRSQQKLQRAGGVSIYGIDHRLWKLTEHGEFARPTDDEVILNQRVAQQLDAQPEIEWDTGVRADDSFELRLQPVLDDGDVPVQVRETFKNHGLELSSLATVESTRRDDDSWTIRDHSLKDGYVLKFDGEKLVIARRADTVSLLIEIPKSIPGESLFGKRDGESVQLVLTVAAILPDKLGVARLSLNPSQQLPANAFVSLETLQEALQLNETRYRDVKAKKVYINPPRVNTLFVKAKSAADRGGDDAPLAAEALTQLLDDSLTLEDLRVSVRRNADHEYLSVESDAMILEDTLAGPASKAADDLKLTTSPVLVYLANEIVNANDESNKLWYSVVAGFDVPMKKPFGPFVFRGKAPSLPLKDGEIKTGGPGEIVLNSWTAEKLDVTIGEQVWIKFHVVGSHGELPETEQAFRVAGIVELDNTLANDRGLTPVVRGITDVDSFDDWEQPFPMKLPVPQRDDDYWEEYHATPKGFISLSAGRELWKSRYGQQTSLRVSKLPGKTLEESALAYEKALLKRIDSEEVGLAFQAIKYDGLQAAGGTTDFSGLFIGFSFFLILSATILIALLFRLGIERRASNIGLLSAIGFSPAQVKRLFFTEGLLVVCLGGLLGVYAAIAYARLMVHGLKTWWYGAIGTKFFEVHVHPASLAIGFGISVIVTSIAVWWALRQLKNISARDLLSGVTEAELTERESKRRGRRSSRIAVASAVTGLLLMILVVVKVVPSTEAFSGFAWPVIVFFLVGMLLLTASLTFLSGWLDGDHSPAVRGRGIVGMGRLGMRNAARHRQRSVFTVGLIASATFVIVAVAAGKRNPAVEIPGLNSGNGGFVLVAETDRGLIHNLDTAKGRRDLDIEAARNSNDAKLLKRMRVMSFRVKPGEDASCLNLYQTRLPTILGVSKEMIKRGGFKFADTSPEQWKLLTKKSDDGTIPVLGDLNTLTYSLKKGIGQTIEVPADRPEGEQPEYTLEVAGMFDGSVFQGVLLMSDENFQKLYPDRSGYQYFLIGSQDIEKDRFKNTEIDGLSMLLETELADAGFDAERVGKRLDDFLAVQNTYLSTFQTLGGLGLLLGTFGLGTVMLRNVLERRSELALLRAVGFRNGSVGWLVAWENAFLLTWGLLAGTVAALLSMTPHLLSTGADVPWKEGAIILGGVFVIGMTAALFAVREAVRTPIVTTLRSE